MPRDIIRTVYTFDELSDSAKERAHSAWLQTGMAWGWQRECMASIEAFCKIAPISYIRSDIGAGHVDVAWSESDWTQNDNGKHLSGVRAWKWLINNGWHDLAIANAAGSCTLTGYCADCPPFDVIKAYCEGDPRHVPDLEQVFYEAAQAWVHHARSDLEHAESLEAYAETSEANGYEYYENGELI